MGVSFNGETPLFFMKFSHLKALLAGTALAVTACASAGGMMEVQEQVETLESKQDQLTTDVGVRLDAISQKQQELAISQQQAALVLDRTLKNGADIKNDLKQIYASLERVSGKEEEKKHHAKVLAKNIKSLEKRLLAIQVTVMETNLAHAQKLQAISRELSRSVAAIYEKLDDLSSGDPKKKRAKKPDKDKKELIKPKTAKPKITPGLISAEELYNKAYKSFIAGSYVQAEAEFADYVKRHPKTDLSDNSYYWLGEAQANQGKLKDAASTFAAMARTYPDSPKAPSALWRAAQIHEKLEAKEDMFKTLQKIREIYPASFEASLAQEKMNSLNE